MSVLYVIFLVSPWMNKTNAKTPQYLFVFSILEFSIFYLYSLFYIMKISKSDILENIF